MGKKRIIVSERDNIAALMEDDKAIEFIIHRGDMLLGDVYLAQVENILPSIDAGFVNVGGDKMGFLHSSDVQGRGPLQDRLKPRQKLVVQVIKEPTGHKGPRVTTNISLPGRFLVLMPQSKGISISRKVEEQKERSRLKSTVSMLKPHGVGVIIRTEANGQKEEDIKEDFETLLERWQNIVAAADTATPPSMLHRDQDLLYRVIREVVTEDVREIIVDTAFGQQRAQQLLQNWKMEKEVKVTLHDGKQSIMIATGVDREIKMALQTKVPLPSGGYLYIEPTEALAVVDVNSGKFTSLKSQAETIRLTNLEACKEIARQLRLRNIGGMIVVDFIDMESRPDQLSILQAFDLELAPDKSKPQMGQLTDLGLVEMTRHRQGQALSEIFSKNCKTCRGTGLENEEFNWAPPNVDGDLRSGRGQFPFKQSRGGRNNDRDRSGGRNTRGGRSQDGKTASTLDNREKKEESPDSKRPITEMIREKTFEELGVRHAEAVKLGQTPERANKALARINPRANDIQTLVASIESGEAKEVQNEGQEAERNNSKNSRRQSTNIWQSSAGEEKRRIPNFGFGPKVLEKKELEAERSDAPIKVKTEDEIRQSETIFSTEDESDEETLVLKEERRERPRRGRGRPRKVEENEDAEAEPAVAVGSSSKENSPSGEAEQPEEKPKKRRGRPPKRGKVTSSSDD